VSPGEKHRTLLLGSGIAKKGGSAWYRDADPRGKVDRKKTFEETMAGMVDLSEVARGKFARISPSQQRVRAKQLGQNQRVQREKPDRAAPQKNKRLKTRNRQEGATCFP